MDPRDLLLSWIELDADAWLANIASFRTRLHPHTRLIVVVKANAYGHGIGELAALAPRAGVDVLGIHTIEEALVLRRMGWDGRILVMGPVSRRGLGALFDLGCEATVVDARTIDLLDREGRARGRALACHLKVETGTHRQGMLEEEIPAALELFRQSTGVALRGVSSHFANIEDTTEHGYAREQLRAFQRIAEQVGEAGFRGVERHMACTAAILTLPETQFDLVRLGIGAYGIWPSRETLVSTRLAEGREFRLHPVLTWKARITETKRVRPGGYVGYGLTHRCTRATRVGVVPIGYSDGYDRRLSGVGHVLVRGQRAEVLGRVCMNILLVDLTDAVPIEAGEEVVLLGRQGAERVSADQIAAWCQTIPYEVLARLSPSIPRIVVDATGAPFVA